MPVTLGEARVALHISSQPDSPSYTPCQVNMETSAPPIASTPDQKTVRGIASSKARYKHSETRLDNEAFGSSEPYHLMSL